jgi:hypothetical protein
MRINGTGAEFAVGAQEAANSPRSGPAPIEEVDPAGSDQVVLSTGTAAALAIKAIVSSGNYEPDSRLTAGGIIDSAIVRID